MMLLLLNLAAVQNGIWTRPHSRGDEALVRAASCGLTGAYLQHMQPRGAKSIAVSACGTTSPNQAEHCALIDDPQTLSGEVIRRLTATTWER